MSEQLTDVLKHCIQDQDKEEVFYKWCIDNGVGPSRPVDLVHAGLTSSVLKQQHQFNLVQTNKMMAYIDSNNPSRPVGGGQTAPGINITMNSVWLCVCL